MSDLQLSAFLLHMPSWAVTIHARSITWARTSTRELFGRSRPCPEQKFPGPDAELRAQDVGM